MSKRTTIAVVVVVVAAAVMYFVGGHLVHALGHALHG